ncbi:MAG: UvrB/UvrC motif-containing protein [Limnochordia bacterium]|jgi:protein arginine kinase activator
MLCQECQKRPAVVHFTKIVNDQKSEIHLCQECARERGDLAMMMEPSLSIQNLFAHFFEGEPRTVVFTRCTNCGLTQRDFRRLGQLGCPECYEHFADQLKPLLRRIHGSSKHRGKIPGGAEANRKRKIEQLRDQLEAAVQREEYELAAKLRDTIKELQSQE